MLITRCPNCGTTFRIRPEQLGVRGGRVRCGSCRTAFSALNSLEEVEDGAEPGVTPAPQAASAPAVARPVGPVAVAPVVAPVPVRPAPTPVPAPEVSAAPARPVVAPLAPAAAEMAPAVSARLAAQAPVASAPQALAGAGSAVLPPMVVTPNGPEPALPPFSADEPLTGAAEPKLGDLSAGRKEPSLESTWFEIDPNLPTGGFNSIPSIGRPREDATPVFSGLDLPKIDDAPPLIDPEKQQALERRKLPGEAEDSFRMEFDLSALDGKKEPEPAPAAVPSEPYKSKIAEELGVAPYEVNQDAGGEGHTEYTYMLNETVEAQPAMMADVEQSLLHMREAQQKNARGGGIEDRRSKRGPWLWLVGVLLFGGAALLQGVYLFRTELARSMPEARPFLEQTCKALGCTVPYPQESAQISIESSNLVADPGEDHSRLIVTMRNKAGYAVAWPYLELTLTDKFDIAISRRVLKPSEWMPAAYAQAPALEGHSEVTATIVLMTGKPEPAGYRLYAFYP